MLLEDAIQQYPRDSQIHEGKTNQQRYSSIY
jgi:hypothetical protein